MNVDAIRNNIREIYKANMSGDNAKAVYLAQQYYTEGIKSPSVATLVQHEETVKLAKDFSDYFITELRAGKKDSLKNLTTTLKSFKTNQAKILSHPMLEEPKKNFATKMKELYPKTSAMRMAIIVKGAVATDRIIPKFKGLKKCSLVKLVKKYAHIL